MELIYFKLINLSSKVPNYKLIFTSLVLINIMESLTRGEILQIMYIASLFMLSDSYESNTY